MKLKAVIVGLGNIASDIDDDPARDMIWSHAKAYSRHPGFELVGVCDSDAGKVEKFRQKWGPARGYDDFRKMLAAEKPDVVSVCTPTSTHHEVVLGALEFKPKAIFCEKPLADSVAKTDELIAACEKHSIGLAVNFMRRWDERYRAPKRLIEAGEIGELRSVVGYGATALMMSTSHLVDMMVYFGGCPQWVVGLLQEDFVRMVNGAPDPGGFAFVRFSDHCTGYLKGTSVSPLAYMFELDLVGTRGRIRISDDGRKHELWRFEKKATPTGSSYECLVEQSFPPIDLKKERMLAALDDIAAHIATGAALQSDGRNARDNIRFIEAIKESSRNGNAKTLLGR